MGSSLFPPPNSRLMLERSLHHSYMLDMSMRLMCFSYPSWLAASRNSSVIRIKPRSKLNSAGNFRIQYLKRIKHFWQPDFKLDLYENYCIILQVTSNDACRQISNFLSPIHHTESRLSLLQSRTQVHPSHAEPLFPTLSRRKLFPQTMASRWE